MVVMIPSASVSVSNLEENIRRISCVLVRRRRAKQQSMEGGGTDLVDLAADGAVHGRQLYGIGFGVETSVARCHRFLIEGNQGSRGLHVDELLERSHIFLAELWIGLIACGSILRRGLLLSMLCRNLEVLITSGQLGVQGRVESGVHTTSVGRSATL